ncbi:MAG: hypothetical protein QOH59_2607 [Gemmatimonadales bacterium]|jgi:hypothetical protein|nr:hypothetical protein [Gemmatimonadales bacterium]
MCRLKIETLTRLAVVALVASACSDAGAPSTSGQVGFNLASRASVTGAAASVAGAPESFTDGTNTLVLSQVELVMRRIELRKVGAAACGESVSDDCQELEFGPRLVDVPLSTAGAARTFSVQIAPGSYDKLELKIRVPSSGSDAGFRQAHPGFEDASVRVTGTYNGEAFVYTSNLEAELEFALTPPLTANETSATDITLLVDLGQWFRDQAGALIPPATANPGQPNEALVEQSIRSSLNAFQDDDRNGADDHGGHGTDDGPGHQ